MFTETLTAHDDTIGLACEGKLSESDLKRMHALLHERLQGNCHVNTGPLAALDIFRSCYA